MKTNAHSSPNFPSPRSFERLVEQFVTQKTATHWCLPCTAAKHRYVLDKLGRWIAKKNLCLSRLRLKEMKAFCAEQRKIWAKHMLQTQINAVYRPFFRWLKREGVIKKDPMERLAIPRSPIIPFCPTKLRDQLLMLSMSVPTSVLRVEEAIWISFIVHSGFLLGMRKEEIRAARGEWFDFEKKCVRIPSNPFADPELQEVRIVPLSESFLTFFGIYDQIDPWRPCPDAANSSPPLFKRNLMLPFRIFLEWAGNRLDRDLLWITPSIMRCTYAVHLLKGKATRSDVARWMGVSESIVAKYYAPRKRNSRDSP